MKVSGNRTTPATMSTRTDMDGPVTAVCLDGVHRIDTIHEEFHLRTFKRRVRQRSQEGLGLPR